jgi:Alpha-L-fucosidase
VEHDFAKPVLNHRKSGTLGERMLHRTLSLVRRSVVLALLCLVVPVTVSAQPPTHYEATLESLNRHPLPQWYADAKLGIFVHWGLYSVPGWAPLVHPQHDFTNTDYMLNNPYAEWYLNSMRIEGSPTQAYHRDHYGANYDYYNFAAVFDREIHYFATRERNMSCSLPSIMTDLPCGPAPHQTRRCLRTSSTPRATWSGN